MQVYSVMNDRICLGNTINSQSYEIIVDNDSGIFIKFSPLTFSVETHEAIVSIYRDKDGRISAIGVEYKDE
ncbi:MAG: hypothetical protein RRE78_10410 [Acidianus sp.]|jgi:hypothetical protein|nr:hypothetical protein [Acidianus sp.]